MIANLRLSWETAMGSSCSSSSHAMPSSQPSSHVFSFAFPLQINNDKFSRLAKPSDGVTNGDSSTFLIVSGQRGPASGRKLPAVPARHESRSWRRYALPVISDDQMEHQRDFVT